MNSGGRSSKASGANLLIARTIDLLSLLSSSRKAAVAIEDAKRALEVDDAGLEEVLDLIDGLSDEETGARIAIMRTEDDLALIGDAGKLGPYRLSLDEAAVLTHILDSVRFDRAARERVERALLPPGAATAPETDQGIGDGVRYGPYYGLLTEAARVGIRCRIRYRSAGEAAPSWRLVDPGQITTEQGVAYLIAWDVEADGERRYRLDRIGEATETDDSVVHHAWTGESTAASLRVSGKEAVLVFPSRVDAERRRWAGLHDVQEIPHDEPRVRATLSYTSESWLLNQVLAAGGDIEIIEPEGLRDRLRSYGQRLIIG